MSDRNADMLQRRKAGETYIAIARRYGISTSRAAQIVAKEESRPRHDAQILARRKAFEDAARLKVDSDRAARISALVRAGTDGTRVDELELSVRTANCLRYAGLVFARDVASLSNEDLHSIPNMGKRSVNEVVEVLFALGCPA